MLQLPDRSFWSVALDWEHRPGPETVILVPPGGGLRAGFDHARRELASGCPKVRLVARGVTLREWWPTWIAKSERLCLTEIDAYLPADRAVLTEQMSRDLRSWLADVFGDAIAGVDAERALWASATLRVFHTAFTAYPLVLGLAHHHARDSVLCTERDWVGSSLLEREVRSKGGSFQLLASPAPSAPFALRAAFWGALSSAAALVVRSREYWNERASRAKLRSLRAQNGVRPRVWVGVLGDWPRVVRHVTEGVGNAARERQEPIGVLIQSSLRAGCRDETRSGSDRESPVFPTLDHPALRGCVTAVDQCASAESVGDFLKIPRCYSSQVVGAFSVGSSRAGASYSWARCPSTCRFACRRSRAWPPLTFYAATRLQRPPVRSFAAEPSKE